MDIETLVSPAADWKSETWGQRVDEAASLLFIHGYITESARRGVTKKLDKQYADGVASGRIVERVKK